MNYQAFNNGFITGQTEINSYLEIRDKAEVVSVPVDATDDARKFRDMRYKVESGMLLVREINEELIAAINNISHEVSACEKLSLLIFRQEKTWGKEKNTENMICSKLQNIIVFLRITILLH